MTTRQKIADEIEIWLRNSKIELGEQLRDAVKRCSTLHGGKFDLHSHTCATCKPWKDALQRACENE